MTMPKVFFEGRSGRGLSQVLETVCATNLLAVRRLNLGIGEQAEVPAAWLALPGLKLKVLPQTYLRSTKLEYEYEAPSVGYKGRLRVPKLGFVEQYPGLFEMAAG